MLQLEKARVPQQRPSAAPPQKMPPEPLSLLDEEEKAEKNIAVIENNTIISVRQMKQIKYV